MQPHIENFGNTRTNFEKYRKIVALFQNYLENCATLSFYLGFYFLIFFLSFVQFYTNSSLIVFYLQGWIFIFCKSEKYSQKQET